MSRVHLKRLEIRELFERSFDLKLENLGEGVTVIYGPNASGKSSLAKAASRVFSTKDSLSTDHVRAALSFGEQHIDVELRGPRTSNSAPQSSRPGLYLLSIPDLISGPNKEDTQLISDTLAGGLDLGKCLPAKGRARPDLENPKSELEQRRIRAAEIAKQELSLEDLERKKERATESAKDLQLIENWIAAAGAENEAAGLEALAQDIKDRFPGIELQQPDAATDVKDAFRLLQDAEAASEKAKLALGPYQGRLPATDLAANDQAELIRLESEAIYRRTLRERAAQANDQCESQIRQLERKLPPFGCASLPIDPLVDQTLSQLVQDVRLSKGAASQAAAAETAAKLSYDRALQTFVDAGGVADSASSVQRSPDRILQAGVLDDAVKMAEAAYEKAKDAEKDASLRLTEAKRDLPNIKDGFNSAAVISAVKQEPSIADLADQNRALRNERTARERIAADLEAKSASLGRQAGEGETAARALADWLKAVPSGAVAKRPVAAAAVAVLLGLVTIVLGFAGAPVPAFVVGAVGLLAVAGFVWFSPASASSESRQGEVQNSVPEAWRPGHWTVAEVVGKLEEALLKTKDAAAVTTLLTEARAVLRDLEQRGFDAELDERLKQLRESTGFDFNYPYEMALLVRRLDRLQQAMDRSEETKAGLSAAKNDLDSAIAERRFFLTECNVRVQTGAHFKDLALACGRFLEEKQAFESAQDGRTASAAAQETAEKALHEFLHRFGWPEAGDPEKARDLFLEWLHDSVAMSDLRQQLEDGARERKRLEEADAEGSRRISDLFQQYGYPAPSTPLDGIRPFFEWFAVSDRAKQAELAVQRQTKALADRLQRNGVPDEGDLEDRCRIPSIREPESLRYSDLVKGAADKRRDARMLRREDDEAALARLGFDSSVSLDHLTTLRERVNRSAGNVEELSDKISTIRARIENATQETGLQAAQKNLDDAIAKSLDWLELTAKNAANRAVLAAIERSTREENTAPVIETANRWLERLTQRRYGSLTDDGNSVTVEDRDNGNRVQRTDQLSTGTKVHLALAIRLAVIEQSETHQLRFPLFLDEVMATSDPNARMALAEALKEVSNERQVIVLTNQPDDVNLLKKAIGEDVPVVVLPKAEPIPIAPPAIAPEEAARALDYGLPLSSSVRRWRAVLVRQVLESPIASEAVLVDEVLSATGNQNDLRIVGALEAVRKAIAANYKQLEWRQISDLDLGGADMRDKVREAWDQNRSNPDAFLTAVDQIRGRRAAMVERIKERLEELEVIGDRKLASEDELVDLAAAGLPEPLRDRAHDIVDVFRDYLSRG